MCSDCYRIGHYKKDCPGARNWMDYCKEFKTVWDEVMLDRNEEFSAPTGLDAEESRLLSMNKELVSQIECLEEEKEKAESKIKDMAKKSGLEELGRKAQYLEKKNEEQEKHIKELEGKITKFGDLKSFRNIDEVHETIERLASENNELKNQIKIIESEKIELENQFKEGEANLKVTYRRLSRSLHNEEINLYSTVCNEMFVEESPPFHGYSTPEMVSDRNDKNVTQSRKDLSGNSNRKSVIEETGNSEDLVSGTDKTDPELRSGMKRSTSSPGTSKEAKKKIYFPEIGYKIKADIGNGKGEQIYTVHYKVNKDKSDMKYCLIQENGKLVTVNLKKKEWKMIEENSTF